MQISRRPLLAVSAGTAAAGAIGMGGLAISWWDKPVNEPYRSMSDDEGAFVRAWSGVAFPATALTPIAGSTANLDHFFDEMLHVMPGDTAKLLRVLLHGLDALPLATEGDHFTQLDSTSQNRLFEEWTHTDVSLLRSATQSLVLLLGMGWSTHPQVAPTMQKLHSCGYGR
jgi:hypothetical protein